MKTISNIDRLHYKMIRKNVSSFLNQSGRLYDTNGKLLDIAPQVHEGAAPYFHKVKIDTFDLDPSSGSTFTGDICENNSEMISDNAYNFVVCTEVLEHVSNPFHAVDEIYRILKPNGMVFASTPYNFRIHGPLPDCWRFTEHGLRLLFKKFKTVELQCLETRNRWLMPIHYTVTATK